MGACGEGERWEDWDRWRERNEGAGEIWRKRETNRQLGWSFGDKWREKPGIRHIQ